MTRRTRKAEPLEPEVLAEIEEVAGLIMRGPGEIFRMPVDELRPKLTSAATEPQRLKVAKAQLRRALVAKLWLSRKIKSEIAAILGVSNQTIGRDIKALEKEWRKERVASVADFIRRELRELDEMERDAAARFHSAAEEVDALRWFRARLELKEKRWRLLGLTGGVELEVLIREELRGEVVEGGDTADLAEIDDAATLVRLYRRKSGATG